MELTAIVTLLVYVVLIIFLIVLSCIIYNFQIQTKVHAPGHFTLHHQCQGEMQESKNMKNLQKMKTLRTDRKKILNLSHSPKPKPRSTIWTTGDFEEKLPEDKDGRSLNDDPSTQTSLYYQNEANGEITEIMTSIKKDLQNKGLYLNGTEAANNLQKFAIEEWNNSFNEKKAKY